MVAFFILYITAELLNYLAKLSRVFHARTLPTSPRIVINVFFCSFISFKDNKKYQIIADLHLVLFPAKLLPSCFPFVRFVSRSVKPKIVSAA